MGDQEEPRDDNVIDAAVAESRHNYDEAVQEGRMLI